MITAGVARAVRLALGMLLVPLLCLVGVAVAPSAGATNTPPTADPGLIGTWTNMEAAPTGLAQVTIASDGAGGLLVDQFGACTPTLCEIGEVPAVIYAPAGSTNPGPAFETNQDEGFERRVTFGQLSGHGSGRRLTLNEYHLFTDASGRHNFIHTERFVPGGSVTATVTGTPVGDYPGGDQAHAANALVGTWHNTDALASGILELDISRAGDGTLLVHQFGVCHPDPCDNGTAPGISIAQRINSTSASQYIAAYDFGFAREIDTASLTSHTLRVVEHIEFTDGSARPNIINVETFTR
jgi:hypothetical protein